jgi:hypothetical protein
MDKKISLLNLHNFRKMHFHLIVSCINRPLSIVYFASMSQATSMAFNISISHFPHLNFCLIKLCRKCSNVHWPRGRPNLRKTFLCLFCAELGWKRPPRELGFYGQFNRYFPKKSKFFLKFRISAVKLGSGFGLCSRCIGVFAFKGGLSRLREALQRCFEFGQVQLKLWQVHLYFLNLKKFSALHFRYLLLCTMGQQILLNFVANWICQGQGRRVNLKFIQFQFSAFLPLIHCCAIFMPSWIIWNFQRTVFVA